MNNLCKKALENGGSVNQLIIPAYISEGLGLTNPSVISINDEYFLNLRHVQYTLYHSEGQQKFQTLWGPLAYLNPEDDIALRTTNYLCKLHKDSLTLKEIKKVDTSKLDSKPLWEFIGLEDARLVNWNDQIQLAGVRRDTTINGEGRIEVSVVSEDSVELTRNRIEPPKPSYCEKNWMPILDMPNHFVKWTSPTEIVKWNPEDNTSETIYIIEQDVHFPRDIRGGSQVITVGEYRIALTHEVDLWHNERGHKDAHYYHRFIVWDNQWNIVASSDEFKFMTANIEFSCGLSFDGTDFIIPFGFQDSTAFILRLPGIVFEEMTNHLLWADYTSRSFGITPSLLEDFVMKPFDAKSNFKLAEFYFNNNQITSALSFYLRASEYGKTKNATYESLLMVAKCLAVQGKRSTSEKSLWLNALAFAPDRPEAYLFLSQWSESNKQYHEAYTYAVMGLSKIANAKPLTKNIDYIDSYQLEFQKAVLAWWIGRSQEAKDDFAKLKLKADTMTDKYKKLVEINVLNLNQ